MRDRPLLDPSPPFLRQRRRLAAIVLYAINLSGATLVGMMMSADARRAGLSKMPEEEAREGRRRAVAISAVFLASVPVALVAPGVAPLLWLALFLDPIGRRVWGRRTAE